MRYLQFAWQCVLVLIKTIVWQGPLAIVQILKRFCITIKNLIRFLKLPHPLRDLQDENCNVINEPAYHRPDPCIYSQPYLNKLGLPITWDNPDIYVMKDGSIVAENEILADTTYEVYATIWNNSYEAPVVGLAVNIGFLSFGASTLLNPIGVVHVNLGVKGGVNHPVAAKINWHTPSTPGHYCLQVNFEWIDDLNSENNIGYNNLTIISPHSPATFSFKLRNNTSKTNRYRFESDTYALPAPKVCELKKEKAQKISGSQKLEQIKALHSVNNFPIPAGWHINVTPEQPTLDPDQEMDIDISITPPDDFVGTMPFNINAYYNKSDFAGGVTIYVEKK